MKLLKHVHPRYPRRLSRVLIVALTAGLGLMARQADAASDMNDMPMAATEATHEHNHEQTDPVYVCPMHPNVVRTEPGRCPICGMDLVAKPAKPSVKASPMAARHSDPQGDEQPTITVSDAVVNQLGVRTAPVSRGTLHRHILGSGVFLRSMEKPRRPIPAGMPSGEHKTGHSGSMMMVLGQVFESDAPLVHNGQMAHVSFPNLGARQWMGEVTSLESQISQNTHTLQFRVSIDNDEGVYVPGGMTAVVRLEVDPLPDVLLVPREAVIVTGKGARVVLALGDGRFQPREVDAEDFGEDQIVIHSGLEEGERVVVSAQFLLDSEASLQAGLRRITSKQPVDEPTSAGDVQ